MPLISEKDRRALRGVDLNGSPKHRLTKKEKKRRLLALILTILPVLIGIVVVFVFILPILEKPAEIREDAELSLSAGKRGSVELSWTPAKYASGYRLELFDLSGENPETPIYERFCRRAKCTLSSVDIPKEASPQSLHVKVTARDYLYFLEKEEEVQEASVSWECCFSVPVIKDLRSKLDNENQKIDLNWRGWEKDTYTVYLVDPEGNREMIREVRPSGSMTDLPGEWFDFEESLSFGPRSKFKLPKGDGEYRIEMEVAREQAGVNFQGETAPVTTVTRSMLMSKTVLVSYDRLEGNHYKLYWNDTGSRSYQVEVMAPGTQDYTRIARVDGEQELVCDTGHLLPGREYTFRVVAMEDADIFADADPFVEKKSEPGAGIGICTVMTEPEALYASIWPVKTLDLYKDTGKAEKIGSVTVGQCLCVLDTDDEQALFRVRTDDGEGYIDSNYCMINLPDYLGDLCQYDIPNSYASIYMVNGYYIPNVTGRVTPGYEDILLDDNTFVVPLLYPVAQKLVDAANATLADGYRIEINDSFRPHEATRSIYDETNKVLYWRLPDIRYFGLRTTLEKYLMNGRTVEEPPVSALPPGAVEEQLQAAVQDAVEEPAEQDASAMAEGMATETAVTETQIGLTDNTRYTYYWEMTNGTFRLGSFLAAGASRHNLGVAMDMTLASVSNGYKPMDMQSEMHNLSWYSAMNRNNVNADLLKKYLTDAGFATIGSEWWHFQDNDLTKSLNPPIVEKGVCIEGWKKDDYGWRYRDRKGNYLKNQSKELNGVSYAFDEKGYTDR
ncbi:MAG: D-alanyl-D-alanine carboxypeptidase family protein [Lachnospiraceae bacterium]|nr:D-alanyl-D-alanine carboxypeptidase family protein [Lachnospiraceae bacterium]